MGILKTLNPFDNESGHSSLEHDLTDVQGSDPAVLAQESGPAARALVFALDKAARMQSSIIIKYVDWLRSKNPDATPAEIQKQLDSHFLKVVTGTGAGAGAASAIPGIGFFTGAAAVGAESLLFLDAATIYTLASARLRNADVKNPERRKALILVALAGSAGSALVDTAIGKESPAALISRLSVRNLAQVNNKLFKIALKKLSKSIRRAWMGKLIPFGIGAVLGSVANRKIAHAVIEHVRTNLGPLPATFSTEAPKNVEEPSQLLAINR